MANEKKTIKTKLVQVGSEKIDMPFSLSELILDSTSGKTVKEQIADLQPKTDNSLTTDDKTIVGSINELKTDVNDLDTKVGTKADDTTSTPATGLFKYIDDNKTDIVDNYLGGKKLVYLTQAEYDLLSDSDKNDATKVYNITDAVEKDYQEKEDNTLNTDDKTIVGAINELDTNIDNIKTEIGKKKIPGTPEVVEEYVACLQTDDGALEVVADGSVTDNNTQIELTTANSLGGSFNIGEYVKHVPHVDAVPEVPGTGMYKFVEDSINQALVGGEVDLSGYQEKTSDNLNTVDKTIEGAINELEALAVELTPYTDTEIEAMFDGTTEEIQYYESLIQDNTVSTNRLFSSQETVNRITQALLDSQKYANDLIGGLSMVKAKKVETRPDTGIELTIYLVGNDTDGYHQWMFIEGAWADLGSTNITLDGYITTEKLTEELAKKADDDKVLKLDKVTTTMSGTPSNANVLSELAVKNLLDGKADTTSLPSKTSELTNDSGFLTTDTLPEYPTPRTDDEIKSLADGQISAKMITDLTSSSTLTQILNAKSLYGLIGEGNLVTDLDTFKGETIKVGRGTGWNNECANVPDGVTGAFDVLYIPYSTSGNYGTQILTLVQASGGLYKTYIRSIDNGTWKNWQRVLLDKDITQTIDSSSTDSTVASTKAVYDNCVKHNNIKTYTSVTQLGLSYPCTITDIVNKLPVECIFRCQVPARGDTITDAPTSYGILTIEKTSGYALLIFRGSTWGSAANPGDFYVGTVKGSDTSVISWKKLCSVSSTVPDVGITGISSSNSDVTLGANSCYCVMNGICYITIWDFRGLATGQSKMLANGLPKPKQLAGTSIIGANNGGVNIGFVHVDTTSSNLYAHVYTANVMGYCSFSYPVAES